jgi:hypothetical protein
MKLSMLLLAAGAMALSPTAIPAKPSGPGHAVTSASQGPTRGVGWNHTNGPTTNGQPGVECEDVRPGRAAAAPGSAFNPEGNAGTHYAGEQPQNSRNTASVSQYDVACLHQPH